jgi:hypothetical protein
MDTDKLNAADAVTMDFGLRREAKRHAAFGSLWSHGKRCRRFALPPQIFAIRVRTFVIVLQVFQTHWYELSLIEFAPMREIRVKVFHPCPSVSICG